MRLPHPMLRLPGELALVPEPGSALVLDRRSRMVLLDYRRISDLLRYHLWVFRIVHSGNLWLLQALVPQVLPSLVVQQPHLVPLELVA